MTLGSPTLLMNGLRLCLLHVNSSHHLRCRCPNRADALWSMTLFLPSLFQPLTQLQYLSPCPQLLQHWCYLIWWYLNQQKTLPFIHVNHDLLNMTVVKWLHLFHSNGQCHNCEAPEQSATFKQRQQTTLLWQRKRHLLKQTGENQQLFSLFNVKTDQQFVC